MENFLGFLREKALCVFCAILVVASVAEGQSPRGQMRIRSFEINGIVWKYGVQGDQAIITSGDPNVPVISADTRGRIKIPSEIDGFRVRRVDAFAFVGCRFLREVDLSSDRGFLDLGYGLFVGCRSLRRVIFPRDFYIMSTGMSPQRTPLFEGCDSIEEIVFLGRVPSPSLINNLGVSLNNRLRFTTNFEKQWRIYVEDYNVAGWAIWDTAAIAEESNDPMHDSSAAAPDYSLADYTSEDAKMDSLVQLSVKFKGALGKLDAAYEKSHAGLVQQRREVLRKGRETAQQDGDLDAVMLYDEAMKSESPIETDNKALLAIYSKFSDDVEKQKRERDARCAKLVELLVAQIESIKVKETKAGNWALAKEAKSYEERVTKLYDSLKPPANPPKESPPPPQPGPGGDGTPQPPPTSPVFNVPGATAYRVFVAANNEKGVLIGGGSFEKGDLLIIQYMGGEMSRYRGSSYSNNPDKRESYYYYEGTYGQSRSQSFVKVEGPSGSRTKISRFLPYDTAKSPYVFEVPEPGRYRLIGYLGDHADGKVSYQVLRVTKFNSQSFRNSKQAKQCQW